jgi:hypothetical protein
MITVLASNTSLILHAFTEIRVRVLTFCDDVAFGERTKHGRKRDGVYGVGFVGLLVSFTEISHS